MCCVPCYAVVDIVVMYGDVCGTLVSVSVFSIMCFEWLIMTEIS